MIFFTILCSAAMRIKAARTRTVLTAGCIHADYVLVHYASYFFTYHTCGCVQRMVQMYTCLRVHRLCSLRVTPYQVLHSYRAKCLANGLLSTRRTRLTTNFWYKYRLSCFEWCDGITIAGLSLWVFVTTRTCISARS